MSGEDRFTGDVYPRHELERRRWLERDRLRRQRIDAAWILLIGIALAVFVLLWTGAL